MIDKKIAKEHGIMGKREQLKIEKIARGETRQQIDKDIKKIKIHYWIITIMSIISIILLVLSIITVIGLGKPIQDNIFICSCGICTSAVLLYYLGLLLFRPQIVIEMSDTKITIR